MGRLASISKGFKLIGIAISISVLAGCGNETCHTSGDANCAATLNNGTATQIGTTATQSCKITCGNGSTPTTNSAGQYSCGAGVSITKTCTQNQSTGASPTDSRSNF